MSSPIHPELYKPLSQWLPANHSFYSRFCRWLREGGYSASSINTYSCAGRLAFSFLDKPYWQIDEEVDLERVRQLIRDNYQSQTTRSGYFKGLLKLGQYLRHSNRRRDPVKKVNWPHFLDGLPEWLAEDVRSYVAHCRRRWLPETEVEVTRGLLGRLTAFLRWTAGQQALEGPADLTPALWFTYLDERLAAGVTPKTTNGELSTVQGFLAFLGEMERPICQRLLRVRKLKQSLPLPRDASAEHLRLLWAEIEAEAGRERANIRRMGIMDRAWFLLMPHSGLRTGEVRRLRRADVNLPAARLRIEQSKGLKDRTAFLSEATVAAMEAYLPLRGPVADDHLFIYNHRPLSVTYCVQRLRTYGRRSGIRVTPHQLRHSCATLLLNAGAPILTVQSLLGHRQIDTTLRYARLYDGTVAADYYRAMTTVEQQLQLEPTEVQPVATPAQMVALVDALVGGTLNESQREMVHLLRSGLLALAGEESDGQLAVDQAVVSA